MTVSFNCFSLVITIVGLTTSVPENNNSVQACVNITQGSVESSVLTYISTSTLNEPFSAIGMSVTVVRVT